jgi:enoyl-CoA hydratase/carnithine racemase
MKSLRKPTTETLGLGTVLGIFKSGHLPATSESLVDSVFGQPHQRGALVISGANGIVGAGKTMQLASRLQPFGIRTVALDFAGVPDSIGRHFPGLQKTFGKERAQAIMASVIRLHYDGRSLPADLIQFRPRFLLEAIPEILEIKKAHYRIFREAFPEIEIRSVTSGFPASELGVAIAHPAFPHETNKIWEVVEPEPSDVTRLFWSLGLIPIPVSDHWSFVLDVLFCGLTLAGLRYQRASNMPYWKIDKHIRKMVGSNPFRAHDAIGPRGANFLTWSCLHHLSEKYGALFAPTPDLVERKESGQTWYPPGHFRPLVNWDLSAMEEDELHSWILGPVIQMTSLMLHENRAHLSHLNIIGELCAQFRRGILAFIRSIGPDAAIARVEAYHRLHPGAASSAWYPGAFARVESHEWQQLYVNAEHDGTVGVISIGRESYNGDVDAELNRAVDWLLAEKIERVIVTGDFHLSTQMTGADVSEFFPALDSEARGFEISRRWSQTARRLHDEFRVSVGFVGGKRCLGGWLELLMHCHYLVCVERAQLGMPEVTLPVVPGMEGCHWPFRKTRPTDWPRLLQFLLTGESISAEQAFPWLIDYAGPLEQALHVAWQTAAGEAQELPRRDVVAEVLQHVPTDVSLPETDAALTQAARRAIFDCIRQSCSAPLSEALEVQAKLSAGFMSSDFCRQGRIGSDALKSANA